MVIIAEQVSLHISVLRMQNTASLCLGRREHMLSFYRSHSPRLPPPPPEPNNLIDTPSKPITPIKNSIFRGCFINTTGNYQGEIQGFYLQACHEQAIIHDLAFVLFQVFYRQLLHTIRGADGLGSIFHGWRPNLRMIAVTGGSCYTSCGGKSTG